MKASSPLARLWFLLSALIQDYSERENFNKVLTKLFETVKLCEDYCAMKLKVEVTVCKMIKD